MADQEQDAVAVALRELLQSEGWRVFEMAAMAEWGPNGYGRRMQEAISSIPHGPDRQYELARIAEQTDTTARAVMALLRFPQEELNRRKPQAHPLTSVKDRVMAATRRGR